ncbi:unnamed protein product [Arctia plantaginis]|uniref:Uncharacterized protein n=1 Tax=Arctia plantaginis TaxID=874455 RepID=A0A8S1BHB8_ARCPL|nr:unnamed protein product [Arctia plantaginis]
MQAEMAPMEFMIPGGYKKNLEGTSGIWTYDERSKNFRLFGMRVDKEISRLERGTMATGILACYRLTQPESTEIKMSTARELQRICNEIPKGTQYNIYLNGLLYTATKNSSIGYHGDATITRQLEEIMKRYKTQGQILRYSKRWLEGDSDEQIPGTSTKKAKRDDEDDDFSTGPEESVLVGLDYDDPCYDILMLDDN